MITMKMTVVVPTYNLGAYVKAMLADLKEQTVDFEAWLVDDGSTDGTAETLADFARGIPMFHVEQLPHQGVSFARNFGIDHATGDGIAFVDGDDMIKPTFVERLSQGLDQDAVLSAVGYDWHRRSTRESHEFVVLDQKDMFTQVSNHGTEVGGDVWNKAFSKKALDANKIRCDTTLHIAEDYLFTATFVAKTPGRYIYVPEVLYTKRNRPDSTIHTVNRAQEPVVFERIYELGDLIK
ncbi:glycosyltransferase family A protein [Secundilactobacillus paracollinoides]|uniref:glycosyltransferase family 2 protein n=1 Tax=Secundilactobacillus paracollinoides TaxID=240427 RepID=UPI003F458FC1